MACGSLSDDQRVLHRRGSPGAAALGVLVLVALADAVMRVDGMVWRCFSKLIEKAVV